jgi:hypothetical protein
MFPVPQKLDLHLLFNSLTSSMIRKNTRWKTSCLTGRREIRLSTWSALRDMDLRMTYGYPRGTLLMPLIF